MKGSSPKIDSYAIQNTRYVMAALLAYEQRLRTGGTKGEAEKAAATSYESIAGKRVTGRTVSRWLRVVRSYGGAAKTPASAFGALKSVPHVPRPSRDLLCQIKSTVAKLSRGIDGPGKADSRPVAEMAVASQLLGDLLAETRNNPRERHLLTINALANRLANTPIHHLHRYTGAPELEEALRCILARLQAIPAPSPKGTA
jgi:hypothetical protein